MIRRLTLPVLILAMAAACDRTQPAQPRTDSRVSALVAQISPSRLQRVVTTLASFGTLTPSRTRHPRTRNRCGTRLDSSRAGGASPQLDSAQDCNVPAPAANDNGSGTALTMELARVFAMSGLDFDATLTPPGREHRRRRQLEQRHRREFARRVLYVPSHKVSTAAKTPRKGSIPHISRRTRA